MEKLYDKCQVCGRNLKDPKSRKLGYGEVCHKKVMAPKTKKLF
jgi:anaerobic ribonucleoside-triphosphate reductase